MNVLESNSSNILTWDGTEELHSVPVTMETELSMSHGAVWNERPGCHFVAAVVAVDTNYASWMVLCCLGYLVGC